MFSEEDNCSAGQEITRLLVEPKDSLPFHTSPVLGKVNPVQSTSLHYKRSFLILFSHLPLYLPNYLLPSGFPPESLNFTYTYECCMNSPSHPYFITLLIFREEYKLWSSLSCNVLYPSYHCCLSPGLVCTPKHLTPCPCLKAREQVARLCKLVV